MGVRVLALFSKDDEELAISFGMSSGNSDSGTEKST
jgi:hypothetical protein